MNEKLSLTELQLIIKDSLYMAMPNLYWVVAEISEIRENYTGHCYLELIEKHPDDKNVRARVKAVIWNNRYRFLKSLFENVTGEPLRSGMKVLVRTKVDYHEIYGLSLIISDIDPSFTVGEMAIKRQMIIKRLEEEGVIMMNKELSFPAVPQRIAIISSPTAAGYSDFIRQLKENGSGYVFYTALFEAIMQGTETEQSVLNALERVAVNADLFDVVAIIRGGGSQSDLSWFDNYNIAYYVTQFPLPVITGIGHDKDISVTDIVAFQSLKTPTAVADYLVTSVEEAENHLIDLYSQIAEQTRTKITKYREITESFRTRLMPLTRLSLSDQKELLSNRMIEIINIGKEYIVRAGFLPKNLNTRLIAASGSFILLKKTGIERNKLDLPGFAKKFVDDTRLKLSGLENKLNILDPVNVLKRGYTLTSRDGIIIKSSHDIKNDDILNTRFSDGEITSRVVNTKKQEN
ncbi:MAG TPA: exodeoxyribonuclease VII large subunit [Bacteroidales bacterium]|nr:exodeoxyribonuclease VII large subunit [Bacteroidales bacterium]